MSLPSRLRALAEWSALGALVGALCGVGSAAFLVALAWATRTRGENLALVYLLPVAGAVLGWVYERYGAAILGGNNLVVDTVADGGPPIPTRMAPMVLFGTVATHLFGGSAGREGTAVQIGASLADLVATRLGLDADRRRQLLIAGVAGGFGSVFGTPAAGAVFGLEMAVIGRLDYASLVVAVVASAVGDRVTTGLGVGHAPYTAAPATPLTPALAAKWLVFAAAVAAAATAFIELTRWLKTQATRRVSTRLPAKMFVGGGAVVVLWLAVGSDIYLGLGVPTIQRAFTDPGMSPATFAWKLVFTAVTLSVGFLGGEVTPLFFVGAALGNALAGPLGIPLPLAAGVGLAAMFATCSNTPLALSLMAVELLGAPVLPHVLLVSAVAYCLVGPRSIYSAQRLVRDKAGRARDAATPLRDLD